MWVVRWPISELSVGCEQDLKIIRSKEKEKKENEMIKKMS